MDPFTLSSDGMSLRADVPSNTHGIFSFSLSTVNAGDLSLGRDLERKLFLERFNTAPTRLVVFKQTHSKKVLSVTRSSILPNDGDGGVTADPDLVLSITVADCLPIALVDLSTGAFSLVHSGWKGTGIVVNALNKMGHLYGSRPADIKAIIGPGIGSCCYNVPEERAGLFSDYGAVIHRDGQFFLDLKAANSALLSRAGVQDVEVSPLCTCCTDYLGSFRREGPERFTRMLAVVGHF